MTLEEIKASPSVWLTPAEIAPVLECDPNVIRRQAQDDPSKLGFAVVVATSKTKIDDSSIVINRWILYFI